MKRPNIDGHEADAGIVFYTKPKILRLLKWTFFTALGMKKNWTKDDPITESALWILFYDPPEKKNAALQAFISGLKKENKSKKSKLVFLIIVFCLCFVYGIVLGVITKPTALPMQNDRVFWISEERYLRTDGYGRNSEVIILNYSLDGIPQLPVVLQDESQLVKYKSWIEKLGDRK